MANNVYFKASNTKTASTLLSESTKKPGTLYITSDKKIVFDNLASTTERQLLGNYVSQILTTDDANYPLLFSYVNSASSDSDVNNTVRRSNSLYYNPSTGVVTGKITSDNLGQNISNTYIKGLSISGKVITYTRGDSTTGTITTQDTTYSAGTGISLSGTTFSNSGVRAVTINGNYVRVNTNGTNADLTVPYASKTAAANITTTQNAIAKYSNTTGTFANSGVIIDGDNNLSVPGNITATGALNVTGTANLNGETYADSITAGSLLVNGSSRFVNGVAFTVIPTAPTATAGDSSTKLATTAFVANAIANGTAGAVAWANVTGKPNRAGSDSDGGPAQTVKGTYTSNGGQQNPNYFGKNKVGFLMMNTTVNSNSQYKDWIIMDCYNNSDVGGAVAFGVNRQSLGAYIMRSAAERTSWEQSAELIGTHNYTTYTVKKDGTGASGTWGIAIIGNAGTATEFSSNASVALTGDVTGSASSKKGWSIATTIGAGKVTNAMLAGSIANDKLANSSITIAGQNVALGGSISLADMGLSAALRFVGFSSDANLVDGYTGTPAVIGLDSYTAQVGDVLIKSGGSTNSSSDNEYVWTGLWWELLGRETSFALASHTHGSITNDGKLGTASRAVVTDSSKNITVADLSVSSATAETTEATTFVYSVTQNSQGKITVKTRPLPTYNNYVLPTAADDTLGGIKTGYSASGKNYAIKVDSSGNAYVNVPWSNTTSFTITANATDGLWDLTGTNGTNAVTYALAPYNAKQTNASFYTGTTNPSLTTRLNYDGYLYATKLYSGGAEVLTSHAAQKYHKTGSWSDLTYTATAVNSADELKFTIPTGTTATTVALGNHTHTTSIATSSATNQVTLAFGTKYALTAGGTSYVFTMPSNPNTNTTYTFASGTTGDFSVTPSGGSAQTVSIGKPATAGTADALSVNAGSTSRPVYFSSGVPTQSAGFSIEYIVGTQSAKTGSWTGVTLDSSLVTGKTIAYKLPYAGSGNASLNLTFTNPTGNATSGAIAVYTNTSRVTTHYGAGSVVILTYDGTYWRASEYWNSNSRDAGYGKITPYQSDAVTAITTTTAQIAAGTYNENIDFKAGNKWIQLAAANGSSDGTDSFTIAHSISTATAGSYGDSSNQTPGYGATFKVPYVTIDEGGHITGISEHTVQIPASDNINTASAVSNILSGSNSETAITYAPYTTQQSKLSFDTSTTNPTRTDRLNLNGYFYATKVYSGGAEVLTSHQSLANYKTKQTAISDSTGTSEDTTATRFIYSISQNANGEINVKTRPLPTYNNYSLPLAASGTRGGIQVGYSTDAANQNYAVQLSSEKAYVNVPWTDTKVTSVGNHYAPSENSDSQLSASATGATAAWSIDVVKGVQIQRDAKGHVTGVTVTSGKIPADPNTDYRVRQTNDASTNANYRILLSNAANDTQEDQITRKNENLIFNPSTGLLSTQNISLTGTLDVTGNSNLHSETTIDSATIGNLLVTGGVSFTQIPTAPTAADGTNNTQLATTAFVYNAFRANDAMVFKGVVNANSDLPATHYQGWTYKIGTAGTYAGQTCEVGDTIYCITDGTSANNAHWAVVQNNIDTLPVARGGTGATTAADARTNLGLGSMATETATNYIAKSIGTTKGDIIYWSAANTPARLAIGSSGQVLKVSSDGIPTWSTDNNSITGVKGNAESSYRTGNVNLTPANIHGAGTTAQFWRGDNTWSDTLVGPLYINNDTDAASTGDTGSLIIGTKAGQNIAIDANEIMSRNNKATSALYLNNDGGLVQIGSGGLVVSSLTASQAVSTNADKKLVSTNLTVSDPTASGTGITYIASISQSAVGKITATKSTVRSATTSQTGVVQLTDSTSSTSTTTAATPNSVKSAYDLADNHKYWANVESTSAAAYNKTPEVANIKINGNTSASTASTKNVQLTYDSTLEVLNFVFS